MTKKGTSRQCADMSRRRERGPRLRCLMILIPNYTRVGTFPEAASGGASVVVSLTIAPWPGNRDDRFPGGAPPRRDRPCAAPLLRPGTGRREAPRAAGIQEPRRRARHHGRGPAAADRRHLVHAAGQPRRSSIRWGGSTRFVRVLRRASPARRAAARSRLTAERGWRWSRATRSRFASSTGFPKSIPRMLRHGSDPGGANLFLNPTNLHTHGLITPARAATDGDPTFGDYAYVSIFNSANGTPAAHAGARARADRDGHGRLRDPHSRQPPAGPLLVPPARARALVEPGGGGPVRAHHHR